MKSTVLRYTVLRLMIFFGCLIVAWLVGLRNDPILLLLVSAAVSVVLSFFLLRRDRDAISSRIADRIEKRQSQAPGPEDGNRARLRRGRRGRRDRRERRRYPLRSRSEHAICCVWARRYPTKRRRSSSAGRALSRQRPVNLVHEPTRRRARRSAANGRSSSRGAGPTGRIEPVRRRGCRPGRSGPSPPPTGRRIDDAVLGDRYLLFPSSSSTVPSSIQPASARATNVTDPSRTITCGSGGSMPHSSNRTKAYDSSQDSRRPSTRGQRRSAGHRPFQWHCIVSCMRPRRRHELPVQRGVRDGNADAGAERAQTVGHGPSGSGHRDAGEHRHIRNAGVRVVHDEPGHATTPRRTRRLREVGVVDRPKGQRQVPQCGRGEMAERVSRALLGKGAVDAVRYRSRDRVLVGPRVHTPAEPHEVSPADESREPDIAEAEVAGLGSSEDRGQIGRSHPVTVGRSDLVGEDDASACGWCGDPDAPCGHPAFPLPDCR